jgi:hypothetical protein
LIIIIFILRAETAIIASHSRRNYRRELAKSTEPEPAATCRFEEPTETAPSLLAAGGPIGLNVPLLDSLRPIDDLGEPFALQGGGNGLYALPL